MRSIRCHIIIAVLALAFLTTVVYAVNWDSNFAAIDLDAQHAEGPITTQADNPEGSATVTLFTTEDAEISANNTVSGPAELSCATDTLVTEYKLAFDGNGSSATGGTDTSYEAYDSFLSTPVAVTYVVDDNEVDVTLWVRASNNADEVADSGTYNATQTLTVTWIP